MTLRPALLNDLDAVLELERSAFTAPHWTRANYGQMILAPDSCLIVACEDEAMLGFVAAGMMAGEAELQSIAVTVSAQRQGVGGALCEAALTWASDMGAGIMLLEVRSASPGPQALYRRLGFVPCGIRPRYYENPQDDAIIMRLELPDPSPV